MPLVTPLYSNAVINNTACKSQILPLSITLSLVSEGEVRNIDRKVISP